MAFILYLCLVIFLYSVTKRFWIALRLSILICLAGIAVWVVLGI